MSIDTFLLSADTTDLNYPEVRPTLDLNFARVKALDPRITFTRASGGSYVGADGLIKLAGVNEARFDHDPVTGESLGLLVEESRSNLTTYSEGFDDASWIKGNAGVTTNTSATTAPDGTNSAEKLSATAVNGEHFVYKTPSVSSSTYTLSIFAKSAGYNFIGLRIDDAIVGQQRVTLFDLSTGTIGVTSNVTSSSIIPYPNGWYRCSITVTGQVQNYVFPFFPTNSNVSYTGDGTSGVYIWGAQLEVGAFPTSYIPTAGSTRTRASDNASITGKNFSEWYRPDEGTIVTLTQNNTSSFGATLYLYNGINSTNSIRLYVNFDGTMGLYVTRGLTIIQANLQFNPGLRTKYKFVGAYKLNDFAACLNGGAIASDIIGLLPETGTITTVVIGYLVSYQNAPISRLTYYPKRLPDAQLQALTR